MGFVAVLLAVTVGAFLLGLMLDALFQPRVSWWRGWCAPALVGAAGLTAWIWMFVLALNGFYSDFESPGAALIILFPLIVLVPIIASGGGVIVHRLRYRVAVAHE